MADASFEFGIPAEAKKAEQERAAIRNEIRKNYQRQINNPNAKGMVLDPAVVRWNHARHSSYQFFRASPRTTMLGIFFGILPPLGIMYILNKYKKYETRMYKEGKWQKPRALHRG